MGDNLKTTINTQTELIRIELDQTKNVENAAIVNSRKMEYQITTTEGLNRLNTYLLRFYYFIFTVIYVVLIVKIYFYKAKRNYVVDGLLFVGFLSYPLVIYYVEKILYNGDIILFFKR